MPRATITAPIATKVPEMTLPVLLLNGPNLNLLGTRQPEIYGSDTLADVATKVANALQDVCDVTAKQSNYEGDLVTWIQEARGATSGIIINPAAYSHTSIAILDALNMYDEPVVEVHISNIHAREEFRHFSYVSLRADHVIVGQGVDGYVMAADKIKELIADQN